MTVTGTTPIAAAASTTTAALTLQGCLTRADACGTQGRQVRRHVVAHLASVAGTIVSTSCHSIAVAERRGSSIAPLLATDAL
jgi:hypothetical protein